MTNAICFRVSGGGGGGGGDGGGGGESRAFKNLRSLVLSRVRECVSA